MLDQVGLHWHRIYESRVAFDVGADLECVGGRGGEEVEIYVEALTQFILEEAHGDLDGDQSIGVGEVDRERVLTRVVCA